MRTNRNILLHILYKGGDHLIISYFYNLDNEFPYEKILKIEKKILWICSSTYRLMVI
jgi:hypothetical protein